MENLKNEKEIFEEILNTYEKNIMTYEAVSKKTGKKQPHRKLKDESYEIELNELVVKTLKANPYLNKDINIKLKLGMPYNRISIPWIHLYYLPKNSKGTRGRYAGISLDKEKGNVEMWIRIWNDRNGKTRKNKNKRRKHQRI